MTGENMEECSTHISSLFFLFQLIFIECLDCVRSCPKHHAYKQEEVTVCLKAESGRSRQVNRLCTQCEARWEAERAEGQWNRGPLVHPLVWGSEDEGEGEDSSQGRLPGVGDAKGEFGKISRIS